ncbi:uncharacterized protein TNCV_243771 [Trichonephila clavipes]|nr:uncharacterized protein TNCV_243771 [Trichonephila clavipes]
MFVPSLQHIVLVKIAVDLHREPDIRNLETELSKRLYQLPGVVWEDIIRRKFSTLDCPSNLQDDIVAMMRPVNFEISDWIENHGGISYGEDLSGLSFNPNGTINRMSTFQALSQDENIKVEERFWMVCHYRVSRDVFIFWRSLSNCAKMCISERYLNDNSTKRDVEFVKRWINWLQRKSRRIPDFLPAFRGQLTPLTVHKYTPEVRDYLLWTIFHEIEMTDWIRSFVLPLSLSQELRLRKGAARKFPFPIHF